MFGNKFSVGMVIKMEPGYHTKNPYYVEVIEADLFKNRIVTSIPGEHELEISEANGNWEYHIKRMSAVGTTRTHSHLLHNQPLD